MKRLATLFLIVTLFYNVMGYYLMFAYQEEQAWVASIEKKDNINYQVIRLNASLYSFVEDTDFEYVNENVVINHKTYHIFKKRIQNNVLSLYYLPNSHQDKTNSDLHDIVDQQLFNTGTSKESPIKKLIKSFLKDYIQQNTATITFSQCVALPNVVFAKTPTPLLASGFRLIPFSPPDLV
ncbi:MAG: hypothetical protein ACK4M4_06510 [Flavobacterium sp.]